MADTITPAAGNKNTGNEPEDLRQAVSDLKRDLARLKEAALQAGSSKFHDLQSSAEGQYELRKEQAEDLGDRFTDSIRRNPLQSIMIAAGVGLLYGMISRR